MLVNKILVPIDFSDSSDAALKYATLLARDAQASVLLLHVQEPPPAYGGAEMFFDTGEADTSEAIERLEGVKLSDPQIACQRRVLSGPPATLILELAKAEHIDLIVMGTHGRTGLLRLVMGSVAEEVVRKATCPVLTIKQPQPATAATE